MKRKVNRVGQNTLTISIPTGFVKKHNIKQGDELEIDEQGNTLLMSKETGSRPRKKASICLDKFNKFMTTRVLHELYRQGVEEIELTFNIQTLYDHKNNNEVKLEDHIKKTIDRFIGMEIVSQTKNKILLESLMNKEEYEKMDVVKNRIFFLIKEFTNEFVNAMGEDFKRFHEKSYDYHDHIVKFMLYYFRMLNFSDMTEEQKQRVFGLYSVIDKCIDKIRHASEDVAVAKQTPRLKKIVKDIFDIFLEMFEILHENCSFEKIGDIVQKRYALIHRMNKEKMNEHELKVSSDLRLLIDSIPDFVETYVAMNMDKYIEK
jgi:antitoxin component of MazEF toxin-antitoxin module